MIADALWTVQSTPNELSNEDLSNSLSTLTVLYQCFACPLRLLCLPVLAISYRNVPCGLLAPSFPFHMFLSSRLNMV